jgi:hypothetical protein
MQSQKHKVVGIADIEYGQQIFALASSGQPTADRPSIIPVVGVTGRFVSTPQDGRRRIAEVDNGQATHSEGVGEVTLDFHVLVFGDPLGKERAHVFELIVLIHRNLGNGREGGQEGCQEGRKTDGDDELHIKHTFSLSQQR